MVEGLIPFVFRAIKRTQLGSRSRNYHRLSSPAARTASCCFPLLQERFLEHNECLPDRLRSGIASPGSDCSEKMFNSPEVPAATRSFKMEDGYYPREFGRCTSSTLPYQEGVHRR